MDALQKAAVKIILENTTSFKAGTIRIEEEKEALMVTSVGTDVSAFFHTELVSIFPMFLTYLTYDDEIKKVVLRIY